MNDIKNIIFDLDGTLIDSSDGVVDAVNYSLVQMGEPSQPAERIKPFIGFPLSQMYLEFTDRPVKELYRHFQKRAAETIVPATSILNGVDDLLPKLQKNGFIMAIATTKIRSHVDGIIKKFGWGDYFQAIVGGDEVKKVKPDPGAFCLALERLGARAENSLVVGDTVVDVMAAKAVPMKVAVVPCPYGGHKNVIDARPDFVLDSIMHLTELLKKSNLQKARK